MSAKKGFLFASAIVVSISIPIHIQTDIGSSVKAAGSSIAGHGHDMIVNLRNKATSSSRNIIGNEIYININ